MLSGRRLWRFLILPLMAASSVALCAPDERSGLDVPSRTALSKGQRIATAAGTITSTAVSPLLGVCLLGAYEYYKTPEAQRARLPFFTSPWFWIPIGLLLVAIVMKDTIGGAVPLLKKPLDAAEVLLVNKAALVLAVFPVVFHETAKLFGLDSIRAVFAFLSEALVPAVYAAPSLGQTLEHAASASLVFATAAIGLVAAFVVWLVGHAVDVLVLLSPFPLLDLLLRGIRTAVFAVLAGLTLFDPRIALVASLVLIVICFFVAGWAFRLAVFGALFSWDLLRVFVFDARIQPAESIRCFTAMRFGAARKRTCGQLHRTSDGGLEFQYRPWLIGARVSVRLDDPRQYEVGRGLFHPSVLRMEKDGKKYKIAFRCLPRYHRSEARIASVLGIAGVRDVRLGRGLRAFAKWLADDSAAPVQAASVG